MSKNLVVLGCSATKLPNHEPLPAVIRYDGPFYRVLRTYLRESRWPTDLSVAVLSAKYGLIGGLTNIATYDQRMTRSRAIDLRDPVTRTLSEWIKKHKQVNLVLGKDYLSAINLDTLGNTNKIRIVEGSIGLKLNRLHNLLQQHSADERRVQIEKNPRRPLYFLPDWEDMLDADFDFIGDEFSHPERSKRREIHVIEAMKPLRVCDGVLVSLAQLHGTKGILRKFDSTDFGALAPESIRKTYGLAREQLAFGDCGAFSYVNESKPTITVEQACALYQLYGFDFGASVDHIPVPAIKTQTGIVNLSNSMLRKRVQITRINAEAFIEHHKRRKYTFIPVGVIQALSPKSYAAQLMEYIEMGYQHVALGGLVPRNDTEITAILRELSLARKQLSSNINDALWVHLFGIFRPKIQRAIREAGVSSFDSATYFRKAWLRSDQNYLGVNGEWYPAIRIPATKDPRTRKRLEVSGVPLKQLQKLEISALNALHEYHRGARSIDSTLKAIAKYDFLLLRSDDHGENLLESYRRTLSSRVWEHCDCPVCRSIGIDAVIFRGYNRNKRRGIHNTHRLFQSICQKVTDSR